MGFWQLVATRAWVSTRRLLRLETIAAVVLLLLGQAVLAVFLWVVSGEMGFWQRVGTAALPFLLVLPVFAVEFFCSMPRVYRDAVYPPRVMAELSELRALKATMEASIEGYEDWRRAVARQYDLAGRKPSFDRLLAEFRASKDKIINLVKTVEFRPENEMHWSDPWHRRIKWELSQYSRICHDMMIFANETMGHSLDFQETPKLRADASAYSEEPYLQNLPKEEWRLEIRRFLDSYEAGLGKLMRLERAYDEELNTLTNQMRDPPGLGKPQTTATVSS